MNDYDSNRIVDLLGEAMQLEKTDDLNEADVVVLNTCSIREKAQEKVFSDLGRIREAKRDRPDMMIAVGGCVASQEGAGIVKRAPWVDVVFGPQTMHRLPEMLGERARTGKPQVDVSFPEIEKFDHCRRLVQKVLRLCIHHGGVLKVLHVLCGSLYPR